MTPLEVRKVSHWPRAPFDVYGKTDSWFARETGGWERFAGGFFTRRAAQRWIERERTSATTTTD
jgi:hypothetical protein